MEARDLNELEQVDTQIMETELEFKKHKKEFREFFIIAALGVVGTCVLFAYSRETGSVVSWILTIICFLLTAVFSFPTVVEQDRIQSTKEELEGLRAKKRLREHFIDRRSGKPKDMPPSYFDSLVQINIENLAEYYRLVKIHTNNSFRVAMLMGLVGFLLVISGLSIGFVNRQETQVLAYISTGSGIIMEFISGIFFYLYNQTIRQLKGYHDSLLAVQDILLSFKIIEDIKGDQERTTMVGKMLELLMSGRASTNIDSIPSTLEQP